MPVRITTGGYTVGPISDPSVRVPWERFVVTQNPDGSHTAQSTTRFPGGTIVRQVMQTVDRHFMPVDGFARLFVGGEYQGTLIRRVVGSSISSLVMSPTGSPIEQTELPGGPDVVLGYHPTTVEGWKFTKCRKGVAGAQNVRILSSSPTWNGGQMSHGREVTMSVEHVGEENIATPAGTFKSDHYLWHTGAVDGDIEVWVVGPDRICARVAHKSRDVVYDLVSHDVIEFSDSFEFDFYGQASARKASV